MNPTFSALDEAKNQQAKREFENNPKNWPGYKEIQTRGGFNPPPETLDLKSIWQGISNVAGQIGRSIQGIRPSSNPVSPIPTSSSTPTSIPQARVYGDPSQMKITYGSVKSSPTPMPTPNTVQTLNNGFVFDYSTIKRDPWYSTNLYTTTVDGKETKNRPNFQPSQPPAHIAEIIRQNFPKEATTAALVAGTENATYDPRRPDNINIAGGIDRGIFQINSDTFNGLMKRKAPELQARGIFSFDDMYDPSKNAQVARMIFDEGGWGRWFGWQSTGYDINQSYYSQPNRVAYEVAQRGGKYQTR